MDIKELSEKMHHFVTEKGWYEADSPRPQTPRNIAASLVIEAAEILEHFQWDDLTPNKSALSQELADVMLYLLQLATLNDIDLEQAVLDKLEVNYGRTWE